MLKHSSRIIFETLTILLMFSALCLMQITEMPFQWVEFFIASIGALLLYSVKRVATLWFKPRPNSNHYLMVTSTALLLFLPNTMEWALFGLLHTIGLFVLTIALLLSKTNLQP
ncbi:hypothetical protein L1D61_27035 [Vibrio mediterranei]|uniref:Uncharacterized protein n=1 Tax=Vibrio mediterranei TaxID=689 RepID=A0A3G4VJP5_9VIBR|nr:hypothetical protein [Vibrio mediterranei]AYV24990.1 hypothetical protein ECB94_27105 [Vibrio mediterranei]MCG9790773.1 hypothetical protein [Vibrio mediterranei]